MEKEIATTCTRDCPCGCSLVVKVKNGEIVSHRADSRNPFTGSFICVKGNKYVERYASPERILTPLLRKGDAFEPVSWDEALGIAAKKLVETRNQSGPLSTLWAQYSGSKSLLNLFMSRVFFIHLGGSTATAGGVSIDALQAAQMSDFGACLPHAAADLENTKNIVVWGRNPAVTNVHMVPFMKRAMKKGAKLIVVDPRYTETAQIADQHIAIRPGGDGYLAIAVAREVRRRQGEVQAFVKQCGNGWEGYSALLDQYEDQDLLAKADVTQAEVNDLASAYWDNRPCSTYLGLGVNWWKQGGAHSRLIHALIFMSGNVGIPGGGANFFNQQFPFSTQMFREEMAKAKERGVQLVKPRRILLPQLGKEIAKATAPPIRLAWIAMFNPVATAPDSNYLRKVLRSLDFVIVTEQFMTATAECADLILPVTTYLEEDDVVNCTGEYHLGPVNAAVPPRGESRSNLWIFQQLAERLGFGDALAGEPWDWIARAWGPLAEQGITMEQVKQGPVRLNVPDVPYGNGQFRTPDGKFQFVTEYEGRPDPEPGFTLLMVKTRAFLNSQLLDKDAAKYPVVSMNPKTMADLGIQDGDHVRIESPLDQLVAVARESENTRTDTVELAPSLWKGDTSGINRLRESILSDMGPTAAVNETKVVIHRAQVLP